MFQCSVNDLPTLGLLGIVAHRSMNTARGMYREFDLNRSQASVLFVLHQKDTISQKELAEQLNVTAPSITSSIQKMEREGYITREQDQHDQRIMRLALTEKGRSCIESVKNVADRMEKVLFEDMNPEERLLFRRLLKQMSDNLENYERKKKA